ncbi:hypothetical protein Vretimale_11273 [Volvox reticuliferus]|uniref:rRNA adenine N(6)-methyltransferase n=1 Tax=Volvox reticuliferus TaxID=1737510 RepID=A0A8J4CK05_9CHLO|nr:hypothetical protein Vretifemale_12069 [Volvox reticuliferus]GIM07189.1 hypothetical protein Vretimale_11273 [Volvox reticuliferus]
MTFQSHANLNHSAKLCQRVQQPRQQRMRLPAGRRSPGGSIGSSPTKGCPRPETQAPRKAETHAPNPSLPSTLKSTEVQVDVPTMGWMWQVGSNATASGSQAASASPRHMPSAVSTVANLYEDRIKAKKSLGQNFLTDDGVLQDIVVAAGVGPGDLVLEVGPGTGNLTKHLLAAGAHVTAVEKDDTLYGRLQDEYRNVPELSLVHGDALKVGLEEVIRGMLMQERQAAPPCAHPPAETCVAVAELATGPTSAATPDPEPSTSAAAVTPSRPNSTSGSRPGKAAAASNGDGGGSGGGGGGGRSRKVKVVANLPYNITKDLLLLLLPLGDLISDLHIMIQHEAAVRLTERTPGGPEWRAANIRTLFYSRPRYRFRISRVKYDPVPGVDGALVTFSLLPPGARPAVPSERAFHALVVKAFSERRKKMRNSLQPLHSSNQVEAALAGCGLNVDARAQDLTLEQFVTLSCHLHQQTVAEGMGLLRHPRQPEELDQDMGRGWDEA